jgi:hypothetical protein
MDPQLMDHNLHLFDKGRPAHRKEVQLVQSSFLAALLAFLAEILMHADDANSNLNTILITVEFPAYKEGKPSPWPATPSGTRHGKYDCRAG